MYVMHGVRPRASFKHWCLLQALVYILYQESISGGVCLDRRWVLLVLILFLITRTHCQPRPGPSLPLAPMSFNDHLLTLINHQVTIHTTCSSTFQGILTAVNPDFLTLYQRVNPPQAAFIPLHMISAVTVSAS